MSPSTIRTIIIAIVLFGLATAAFIFMWVQAQQQGEQLLTQLNTIGEQQAHEESYFRLRRVAEESGAQRAQLSDYFFASESESIDFLNTVEAMAPEVGVTLETNSLDLIEDTEDSQQWVEIDFSFSGSRSRVQKFLSLLELLPFVSKITTVSLVAVDQTIWQAEVTMRVRVLNYDT